ncbi:DHA2 family efflux MFS transporter permease subunit [Plantactinospora siamensis]|uniref:DHA2 family efflux MFS transporter permease subunit n=1 Tax=Plantactinospora siamensis TaxID=555372 RepID=A0ABV6NZU5_9ACTN
MNASGSRRWWGLAALALSALVVGLDITVLNVALPTLATALRADTGDLQWIANSYNLALAAALLPAGLLGDRFGRRRLLLGALVVFAAASVACAYAGSVGWLIAARGLLGLAAAAVLPLCMSLLPTLFGPQERTRALAVWVTANGIGIPLGPIVGGWLLDNFWWGSVFLINVPVIAAALVAGALLLPESRAADAPRLDLAGVALSSAGLVAVTYGAITAGGHGLRDASALAALAGGVLLLAAFVAWQRRAGRAGRTPLVDLALFRSRAFTWSVLLVTVVTFAMFGALFTLPQYFQAVRHADALGAGLRLLPVVGGLIVGARLAGRLAPRTGPRAPVCAGLAVLAVGMAAGTTTGLATGYAMVAGWLAVTGVGMGLVLSGGMDAALGSLPPERSGAGSALIQALRQVGGTLGVALLGSVLNTAYRDHLALPGAPGPVVAAVRESAPAGVLVASRLGDPALLIAVRSAFVSGMTATLWVCAAVALAGAALAALFLPGRAPRRPEPAPPAVRVGSGTAQAGQLPGSGG